MTIRFYRLAIVATGLVFGACAGSSGTPSASDAGAQVEAGVRAGEDHYAPPGDDGDATNGDAAPSQPVVLFSDPSLSLVTLNVVNGIAYFGTVPSGGPSTTVTLNRVPVTGGAAPTVITTIASFGNGGLGGPFVDSTSLVWIDAQPADAGAYTHTVYTLPLQGGASIAGGTTTTAFSYVVWNWDYDGTTFFRRANADVLYVNGDSIASIPKAGTPLTLLYKLQVTGPIVPFLRSGPDALYFSSAGAVMTIPKTGAPDFAAKTFATTPYPADVAVDSTDVYIADSGSDVVSSDGKILRVPRAGGAAVTIASSVPGSEHVWVDDTFVYWSTQWPAHDDAGQVIGRDDTIVRAKKPDGAERTVVYASNKTLAAGPTGFAWDATSYYVATRGGKLLRVAR
jgi:hypothetical protein